MTTAGYSGTPLAQKLGIKKGHKIYLFRPPEYFCTLFDELPQDMEQVEEGQEASINYMHFFVIKARVLDFELQKILPLLKKVGLLWISWPKKTSGMQSEVDKGALLQKGREIGLVDVKVAAIDDVWSGQKFVYRKGDS
jgi:hypothetical protein